MADESKPQSGGISGHLTKIVAAVFAGIICPIAVAVGLKWANTVVPEKEPAKPAEVPKEKEKEKEPPRKEYKPGDVIDLVTPNLAEHFYQFAWNEQEKKDMRSDVIDPELFRYDDREKPARIFVTVGNGKKRSGLSTKAEFENYVLNLWYRWGKKPEIGPKDPREGFPRSAAVSVHVTGADGAVVQGVAQNFAIRLGEGQFGTINLTALPGVLTCKAKVVETILPDKKLRRVFSPDAPSIPISSQEPEEWVPPLILRRGFPASTLYKGTWTGEGVGQGWHPEGDPTIKKSFPPYGPDEWNKVRIDCQGNAIKVHVNGKVMNEITDLNIHAGRITIGSQGADWEIGRLVLELKHPPKTQAAPEKAKQ